MGAIAAGVVAAGATIYSAREKKRAAEGGVRAQERAADEAIAEQQAARALFEERTEPFRQVGLATAAPILSQLGIKVPDAVLEAAGIERQEPADFSSITPLASFLRKEGFEDIQESAAAQGRLRSGGTLQDLERFSTNLYATLEQQRFNQLFNVLGLGSNIAAGQGTAALQTAANVGELLRGRGAAQAQGRIQQAEAVSEGIGNLGSLAGFMYGGGSAGMGI